MIRYLYSNRYAISRSLRFIKLSRGINHLAYFSSSSAQHIQAFRAQLKSAQQMFNKHQHQQAKQLYQKAFSNTPSQVPIQDIHTQKTIYITSLQQLGLHQESYKVMAQICSYVDDIFKLEKLPQIDEKAKKTYAFSYSILAQENIKKGQIKEGVDMYIKALQVFKRFYGQGHFLEVEQKIRFANMLFNINQFPQLRQRLYSQALEAKSMIFGMKEQKVMGLRVLKLMTKREYSKIDHKQVQQLAKDTIQMLPQTHITRLNGERLVALILQDSSKFEDAKGRYKILMERVKDSDDPNIQNFYSSTAQRYAHCLVSSGVQIQSWGQLKQVIERVQKIKGSESTQFLNLRVIHAIGIQKLGYLDAARQILQSARDTFLKIEGNSSRNFLNAQMKLANCLTAMSILDQALEKNKQLYQSIQKFYPKEEYWCHRVKLNYVIVLYSQRNFSEALTVLEQITKFIDMKNIPSNDDLCVTANTILKVIKG